MSHVGRGLAFRRMDIPEVHFVVANDGARIAYQDFGDGPPMVLVPASRGHLEGYWWFLRLRQYYERLAANLRVLLFDHRGTGLSDGFTEPPTLSERTLDIKAVMDDAGVDRAGMLGFDFGAQLAVAFATSFPERVDRLVLANSRVGPSATERANHLHPVGAEQSTALFPNELIGVELDPAWVETSPSIEDDPDLSSLSRFERLVGSRDRQQRQADSIVEIDVTDIAPHVAAPTLITHSVNDRSFFHVGYSRVLAELIPHATLTEFEGEDHMYWVGDNWREVTDAHIEFLADGVIRAPVERDFAVVLFTDIVGSTSSSTTVGDVKWRSQLDSHDHVSKRVIEAGGGTLVKNTGDGVLAIFKSPSEAVTTSATLRRALAAIGIDIRAGLHAGEIEIRDDDVSGAVVNLAARVEQTAADGDIYVTRSLRDLLLGSNHEFVSAGEHNLKGFEGTWELHKLIAD